MEGNGRLPEERSEKPERQDGDVLSGIFDYMESFIFAAVAVVLLCTFVFRLVRVDGESMVPTLEDGDFLISTHAFYQPREGDIVVVTQPNEITTPLIKRVVATQGDTIDIDYKAGLVTINGEELYEPYINEPTYYLPESATELPLVVPRGKVFVMGDNRNNSSDSRDSRLGLIDERYIMGKTFVRIMPLGRIGGISKR